MSKKIARVDKYQASADDVWAMLHDRAYIDAKYQALGDIATEVETFDPSDSTIVLKVKRTVPADLPDFAKKILGDTNRLVQDETWRDTSDGYACDLRIEFPGKPLHITGKLLVKATGEATSDWVVDMEVKASVPLIGGKLEGVVEKETRASLDNEYSFNQDWLAG